MKHSSLSWLHAPLTYGALTKESLKLMLHDLAKITTNTASPGAVALPELPASLIAKTAGKTLPITAYASTYLSAHLSTHLSAYLSTYSPTYPSSLPKKSKRIRKT